MTNEKYFNNVDRKNFKGVVCNSVNGGSFVITDYYDRNCVAIEFLDTKSVKFISMKQIREGYVKDVFAPSVQGVGIFGDKYPAYYKDDDGKRLPYYEYTLWSNMLQRCYNNKFSEKRKSYDGCVTSENFNYYPYFKEWCNKQVGFNCVDDKGKPFSLDKDILVKGNKVYSENNCCFVPSEINVAFTKSNATRGEYPIGVSWNKGRKSFVAQVCLSSHNQTHLGYFKTVEEAFHAYKEAKESYIKELAYKYHHQIDVRAYNALMNYRVEETD